MPQLFFAHFQNSLFSSLRQKMTRKSIVRLMGTQASCFLCVHSSSSSEADILWGLTKRDDIPNCHCIAGPLNGWELTCVMPSTHAPQSTCLLCFVVRSPKQNPEGGMHHTK